MLENKENKYELPEGLERSELTSRLVEALMDENAPDDIYRRLLGWFESPANEKEKLAALAEYMHEHLSPDQNPHKESTLRKFNELAARLGIAISQVRSGRRRPLGIFYRAAAVLIPVIFVAGGYLWYDFAKKSANDDVAAAHISVPESAERHIVLTDGSEVTLAAGSRFEYTGNRKCTLRGEGRFKVAKGEEPFIVHTGHVDVTVLGTEFNLSAREGEELSTVTLYSGSVRVDFDRKSHLLEAGQEFSYDHASGMVSVRNIENFDASGKSHGRSFSREYSLDEIFGVIEAGYRVSILNKQIADTTQRYNFKLETGNSLETVLSALRFASGDFDYRIEGDTVIIEKIEK